MSNDQWSLRALLSFANLFYYFFDFPTYLNFCGVELYFILYACRDHEEEKNEVTKTEPVAELTAAEKAEKARQRAAELNAKLSKAGKVAPQMPAVVPPPQLVANWPSRPLPGPPLRSNNQLPEVKKLDSGASYAEYVINDVAAR